MHFTSTYDELARDFQEYEIPTDNPGFCDHENFLVVETREPHFLNNYAAFVARRPYEPAYLDRARAVTTNAAVLLHQELLENGRLGACVDIAGILSRILEYEGIWNCAIKGSLTIEFPVESGLERTCFYSADYTDRPFVAPHAWIYAPPFTVVDLTVKAQPYDLEKLDYIPEMVLSEERLSVTVDVEELVSPAARANMLRRGIPPSEHLIRSLPQANDMIRVFPAISIRGLQGATLKYSPVAVLMPTDPLDQMRCMDFRGRTPRELYDEVFRGRLEDNNA